MGHSTRARPSPCCAPAAAPSTRPRRQLATACGAAAAPRTSWAPMCMSRCRMRAAGAAPRAPAAAPGSALCPTRRRKVTAHWQRRAPAQRDLPLVLYLQNLSPAPCPPTKRGPLGLMPPRRAAVRLQLPSRSCCLPPQITSKQQRRSSSFGARSQTPEPGVCPRLPVHILFSERLLSVRDCFTKPRVQGCLVASCSKSS